MATSTTDSLPEDEHNQWCSCDECWRTRIQTVPILDFSAIAQRDAMTAATWFTGPASGPAQAYRDRRALIEAYAALRADLAKWQAK